MKKITLLLILAVLLAATLLGALPTASNAAVPAAPSGGPIYKYLIHQNTGGPVACGDSLVAVYVGKRTGDVRKDTATALKSLFATGKNSGGLYNPLSDSKLRVRRVEYTKEKQNTQIYLGGKLVRPKTYCESARARAMVWATAQQFSEVRHATIWIGSALLGDLLAPSERSYKN
ncbi:MAG: hypothetical protein MUE67_12060 [Anaerolineales bacterium]|jgi:hypothetical protein|nr:hypothetical protein [Anaerolineales bacterium]